LCHLLKEAIIKKVRKLCFTDKQKTERERERQTDRERETDRQTERERDRETDRQRGDGRDIPRT